MAQSPTLSSTGRRAESRGGGGEPPPEEQPEPLTYRPVRHVGRWVAVAIVLLLGAMLVNTLVTNPRYQWSVVWANLATSNTLDALWITIELTVISMAIGVALGTVLAVMRLSPSPLVSSASGGYVWVFRGTPVIVQILFWNFLSALYPRLSVGIPFGPELFHGDANILVTPFTAAILGLGLNEAAYMAEIVRAGILSVGDGQTQASMALGLTRMQTMRRIILPQAMRMIVPPTGNEMISMLKTSSLASVIAVTELLYSVQIVYSRTFQQIPLLLVAVLWYLVLTTVFSIGQYYIERHFARGTTAETPTSSPWRVIRRSLRQTHAHVRLSEKGVPL